MPSFSMIDYKTSCFDLSRKIIYNNWPNQDQKEHWEQKIPKAFLYKFICALFKILSGLQQVHLEKEERP